jgi:hypothetical protein
MKDTDKSNLTPNLSPFLTTVLRLASVDINIPRHHRQSDTCHTNALPCACSKVKKTMFDEPS